MLKLITRMEYAASKCAGARGSGARRARNALFPHHQQPHAERQARTPQRPGRRCGRSSEPRWGTWRHQGQWRWPCAGPSRTGTGRIWAAGRGGNWCMHRLAGTSRRAWGKLTRPSSCERPGPVKGVGEERRGPLQRRVRGLSGTGVPARCGVSGARTASRAARPAGVLQSTAKVKVVAMVTEWRGNVQQLVLSTDACSKCEGVKV